MSFRGVDIVRDPIRPTGPIARLLAADYDPLETFADDALSRFDADDDIDPESGLRRYAPIERRWLEDRTHEVGRIIGSAFATGKSSLMSMMYHWEGREAAARKRFENGLKAIREGFSPKRDRSAVRREARSSVIIPSDRGSMSKKAAHLESSYRQPEWLANMLAVLGRWEEIYLPRSRAGKQRPVFSKEPVKSELLGSVRAIVYVPVDSDDKLDNRPVIAWIIGRCRSQYIKFLSWRATFDQSEVITLIRRLDFRGMASLKRGLDVRSLLSIQLRSDYGTDDCGRRALCA